MDPRHILDQQHGVVSRPQLLAAGWDSNDVRRALRAGRLTTVHRGVYAQHNGPLSWLARASAATLFHPRSALCDASALHLSGSPIHVAIEHPRSGTDLPGVRLHRLRNLEARVLWNRSPPRLRVEEAALDVAGRATDLAGAVAVLAGVCQRRETTAGRLKTALDTRARSPRGTVLRRVLDDVAAGAQSVLEHGYLTRLVRPHGLPTGSLQARQQVRRPDGVATVYRDVLLAGLGLAVELDGYEWHGGADARAGDLGRDLDAAAMGVHTIRLGWHQVYGEPCRSAQRLAAVMQTRGWGGRPCACSAECVVGRLVGTW